MNWAERPRQSAPENKHADTTAALHGVRSHYSSRRGAHPDLWTCFLLLCILCVQYVGYIISPLKVPRKNNKKRESCRLVSGTQARQQEEGKFFQAELPRLLKASRCFHRMWETRQGEDKR